MSRLRVASRLVAGIALCLVLGSVLGGLAAASEVIDPADVRSSEYAMLKPGDNGKAGAIGSFSHPTSTELLSSAMRVTPP